MPYKVTSKWYNSNIDKVFKLSKEVIKSSRFNVSMPLIITGSSVKITDENSYEIHGRTPFFTFPSAQIWLKLSEVDKKTKVEIKIQIRKILGYFLLNREMEPIERALDEAIAESRLHTK